MATISTLAINMIARTGAFEKGMRRSSKRVRELSFAAKAARFSLVGLAKGLGVVAGVGGFLYAVKRGVRAFADFQDQMAMVSTMLDEQTMHLMPKYAAQIKRLSTKFGESTATLSKGLYDILSASVAPVKALEVLSVAVKAAKAGMTDTGVAADAITTILNSYSLAANRAGYVSDILFAIVKRGKTTMAELAPAIGKVAAIASVTGLSFEELGAAIATITRAGLQTDVAMTSLRGLMTAFLKPSKDAQRMAAKFGFQLSTATLQAIGLTGVLQKLKGATAEQLAVLIPNVRGLAGFAAALKQAEKQANDLQLMLNATGKTQEAFEKTTKSLGHTYRQLGQNLLALLRGIGWAFSPIIKALNAILNLVVKIGKAVKWFMGGGFSGYLDKLSSKSDKLANDLGKVERAASGLAGKFRVLDKIGGAKGLLKKVYGSGLFGVSGRLKSLRKTKEDIKDVAGAVVALAESDVAGTGKGIAEGISGIGKASQRATKIITMLQKQLWGLVFPEESMRRWAAAAQGANKEQLRIIDSLSRQIKAAEVLKTITEDLSKTQLSVATFGMEDFERQIYQVDQLLKKVREGVGRGVSPRYLEEAIKQADELKASLRELEGLRAAAEAARETERKLEELSVAGKRIWEATRTPLEKYETEIEKLGKLYDTLLPTGEFDKFGKEILRRAIDWETYGRAVKRVRDELERATKAKQGFASDFREIRSALVSISGLSGYIPTPRTFDFPEPNRAWDDLTKHIEGLNAKQKLSAIKIPEPQIKPLADIALPELKIKPPAALKVPGPKIGPLADIKLPEPNVKPLADIIAPQPKIKPLADIALDSPQLKMPDLKLDKYEREIGRLGELVNSGSMVWDVYTKRIQAARTELEGIKSFVLPETELNTIANVSVKGLDKTNIVENQQLDALKQLVTAGEKSEQHLRRLTEKEGFE